MYPGTQHIPGEFRETNTERQKKETERSRFFMFRKMVEETTGCLQDMRKWRINTYFDACGYKEDESNPLPSPIPNTGSLPLIFLYYSKQSNPIGQMRGVQTFENVRTSQYHISFGEILAFCQDFGLFPHLLSKGDIYWAYGSVQCGRGVGSGSSDITYPDFLQVLVMLANAVFSRGDYLGKYSTALERVRAFTEFCDLKNTPKIKKKLQDLANSKLKLSLSEKDQQEEETSDYLRKNTGNPFSVYPKKELIERECIDELRNYDVFFLKEHWISYHAPMINVGTITGKKEHRFKISVLNCAEVACNVYCDTTVAPFFRTEYSPNPIPNGYSFPIKLIFEPTNETGEHILFLNVTMHVQNSLLRARENPLSLIIPIYVHIAPDDPQADFVPIRSIPTCENIWDVMSPRMRTSFHPDALQRKHLIYAAESKKNLSLKPTYFTLPSKEEVFFKLNPPVKKWELKKIESRNESSASTFVDLANARIRQNEMEKELKVQMSDVNLEVSTDPESVKIDKRARRTLTKLLVGNVLNQERIKPLKIPDKNGAAKSSGAARNASTRPGSSGGPPKTPQRRGTVTLDFFPDST